MSIDRFLILLAALCLAGCPTPRSTPDDDDDDAAGDDDDAAGDDDDVVQEEYDFTFDPAAASAGSLGIVNVDLGGMDPSGSSECCNEHVTLLQTIDPPPPGGLQGFFFFGVLGDGAAPWGLESDAAIGEGEFTVSPLAEIPELALTDGAGTADGEIGETPYGFDVYAIEVPADSTVVGTAVHDGTAPAFQPAVWLLEDDGWTLRAFSSRLGELDDSNFAGGYVEDAATWYLRVMDFATGGDPSYTYTLDVAVEDAPDAISIAETEPNDSDPWEFLGELDGGIYEITGNVATDGWTQTPQFAWTGDLDAFSFSLQSDAQVEFELDWAGDSDLDLVVYGFDNGTPNVGGFDADEVVLQSLATLNHPETGSVQLAGSTPYVAMVANFEGDPELDWTMTMRVIER